MANEIGKILLYFNVIETGDPNLICLSDHSQWRVLKDMPSYIEITIPGTRDPIILPFKKKELNWYNSLSLGISCHVDCESNIEPLPDGVYEFCLKGGKDGQRTSHRYYLKKDIIQTELDEAWLTLGLEYEVYNKEVRDRLLYVNGFLDAASSAARQGKIPRAKEFFNLAKKSLEDFKKCKDCI